jgi:signal transduction histidine kinase
MAEAEAKSKSRLLAATSHDLKQPLQIIVMCLDRLLTRPSDKSVRQDTSRALRAAERLARELDHVLAVARIESGTLEPRIETVDLGSLMRELAEEYRPFAEEKGLSLKVVPTRARIRSDRDLLRHIIQNLMSNAVKCTERGRVLVDCRRCGIDRLSIEIHDTGIGIPADQIDRIFEEFRRVDPSRGDGVGLGLSIVKRLADLLGHRLAVWSWPGKGTCFLIEVPIA